MSGWGVIIEKHVVPLCDERYHITDTTCWCAPTQDDDDQHLYVHHSADGREAYEKPQLAS